MAERTLSLDSRIAASGSPTILKEPLPLETTVSIRTGTGSTPTSAHEVTDEYMKRTYRVAVTRIASRGQPACSVGKNRYPPLAVRYEAAAISLPAFEPRISLLNERRSTLDQILGTKEHGLCLLLEGERLLKGHRRGPVKSPFDNRLCERRSC